MADAVALARTASSTAKMASALKGMWDERTKTKAILNEGSAFDMVMRAQIDEVFLVLAHLGEAVLPLGVFNKDYYMQTLGDVQASIASCGYELLPMAWAELDADLQYVCTAGFVICACYAPMPLYRGFGACVLSDWDWACPDVEYLREKAQKKAIRTVYGFKQKTDPQPTRPVFRAFDQAIQILQVKPMAFLARRPGISQFAETQPRFGGKPKKEVKNDLDWVEELLKHLEKRGHPAPKGTKITSWGIPFATWTSPFSCRILRSHKDTEAVVCNQMDPGRILHAFVSRGSTNFDEGQVLLLPPRSPAESLLCWLEGLPGTSHQIVKWQDLDTEYFEKKIPKSLRKKIGQYPLPAQYAIRNPKAASRSSVPVSSSSPALLEPPNSISPPPYSPSTADLQAQSQPVAELGSPDVRELPASPARSPTELPQHAASLPVPGAAGSSGLKSIHNLRRSISAQAAGTSSTAPSSSGIGKSLPATSEGRQELAADPLNIAELPEENLPRQLASNSTECAPAPAVELPTNFQSQAPRPLARKAVGSESTSKSVDAKSAETVESIGHTQVVQEPEELQKTDATEREQMDDQKLDHDGDNSQSPKQGGTSNQYLELLNKVARGEISPQVLGEMLRKDDTGAKGSETNEETGTRDEQAVRVTESAQRATESSSRSLPYPLLATERKDLDWKEESKSETSVPYPLSPMEKDADAKPHDEAIESDVPISLRPGAPSQNDSHLETH